MQKLRAALEKLDEAIDHLDDLASAPAAAPQTAVQTITPRSPSEIYRAELIRRLDETIEDVQQLMERAA